MIQSAQVPTITHGSFDIKSKITYTFKLEKQAFLNISKEQQEQFMEIFSKIHDNMKQGKDGSHG